MSTPNEVALAEEHTPSKSLDCVSLLIYRDNDEGKPEILVRYNPEDATPIYSTPKRTPFLGHTALETAMRVGTTSLGVLIPPESLDYRQSVVIENAEKLVKIRVFILKSTPDIAVVANIPNFKGWQYVYLPISAMERVWFHEDVGASQAALREMLRTR
ncbi:hypothetical protein ONZ43_g491 [Nemania bipapillata]|uniref:Uncharacterized protein n=1 Tax=Nemania bipapillata TaxID=110536 RepID=A0ACC2J852_9PEZI|nr:hypothetical protein ONZ43_g491 [Nemania bipapillata]